MKVAFVVPKYDCQQSPLSQFSQCRVLPPLGLARMAGIAGKRAAISIVDERIETPQHKRLVDISIIFINSYNSHRANTIAKQYRNFGSIVVLTGPILTHAPQDAHEHADSLFIGAGEECLPYFFVDHSRNRIKRFYHSRTSQTKAPDIKSLFSNNFMLESSHSSYSFDNF